VLVQPLKRQHLSSIIMNYSTPRSSLHTSASIFFDMKPSPSFGGRENAFMKADEIWQAALGELQLE
jgi:hypothetical protein